MLPDTTGEKGRPCMKSIARKLWYGNRGKIVLELHGGAGFPTEAEGFPVLAHMAEMAGGKRVAVYAMAPEWLKKFCEDAEACHD